VVYLGVLQLPDLIGKDKLLGEFLADLHAGFAWLLLYVFLLHAAAALKHHFIDRDDTLRRMLRWSRR
jgi:cytochrome b561